jgi:hypothetical protein
LNDFGRDITGLQAVYKARIYYKGKVPVARRTLKIISGPGCDPEPRRIRSIAVRWYDGAHDQISSYDLEYVIDEQGNKIYPKDSDSTETETPLKPTTEETSDGVHHSEHEPDRSRKPRRGETESEGHAAKDRSSHSGEQAPVHRKRRSLI